MLECGFGEAWTDNLENPQVAELVYPAFRISFIGGDVHTPAVRAYAAQIKAPKFIMPASQDWRGLLEELYPGRVVVNPRFAFSSASLDPQHLQTLAAPLPDGYQLKKLDLPLAQKLEQAGYDFSPDHMTNFDSVEDFLTRGFGYCVLHQDEIVCVASTFTACKQGIEIQINTNKSHRGKGLATITAAHLILESLEKGLDPGWDAATEKSANLAKKLGYTPGENHALLIIARSRLRAKLGKWLSQMND